MKHSAVGQRERATVVTKSHIDKVYKDGFKGGVRKMQERLQDSFEYGEYYSYTRTDIFAIIDQTAEELLEETK